MPEELLQLLQVESGARRVNQLTLKHGNENFTISGDVLSAGIQELVAEGFSILLQIL